MILEAVLILSVILCLLAFFHRKPNYLPPGEWGFPVIGYLPSTRERVPDMVRRLHAKHGKIFCVKTGARLSIFISDYETIKSTTGKLEFSGRPEIYTYKILHYNKFMGLIFPSGPVWESNRKFSLRVLSKFGMGKSKLEGAIKKEAATLVDYLRKKVGKSTNIDWSLNVAILNVIWGLVAERKFDLRDPEIQKFSKMSDEIFNSLNGPGAIFEFYPWLIPITPNFVCKLLKVDRIERNRDMLFSYFKKIIDEHILTLDESNIRDYIDMYLIEMAEHEKKDMNSNAIWNLRELSASLFDLFIAGTDTTSNTIRWYFLYMAKYPKIQKRIQQEIDSVVPRERLPSLEDKDKLCYFEATTYELARKISLVPLTAHAAINDAMIDGYYIPKGASVMPSLFMCHSNAEYWERPNEFYPEHFLKEGQFYIRKEGFMPFGTGRRQCLGESMAKMELYLFMGAILQNFTISEPEGQYATLEPFKDSNAINKAQQFKIVLAERLSYFEATTYELLRKVSLAPFGLPHAAVQDGLIDGYEIPKGTIIVSSIEVCHNSSEYWDRPNEFYPEHFLNEEGKFYIRKKGFLPFSIGRRQCLGESLAKMELFLFMGAILQNFTISEPNGRNASLEPISGPTINKPEEFEILLTKR